jgi:spermidine synthase
LQPWKTLDRKDTPEGPLELRQRGERSFLITIAGRVLMTSEATRSEQDLARVACEALAGRPRPRMLLGGLGMGYTLRAALDLLPPDGKVVVVDLNRVVVDWCRGPLATLSGDALADRRVSIRVDDVTRVIAGSDPGAWDAIVLDLYEGPHQATNLPGDPLYGTRALERSRITLRPEGVLAIWSEEPDRAFEHRLVSAGFAMEKHRAGGGRSHVVYLGRPDPARRSARRGR